MPPDDAGAQTHPFPELPAPDPAYDPEKTVWMQLDALSDNDDPVPDAGIKTAYNFASPANRRQTGPYERFAELLRSRPYEPMIDHVEAVTGPPERSGPIVTQRATVTGTDGRTVTYQFRLSKATTGPFRTAWQTDALKPD